MPVNTHLRWFEINDFTPGLWEAESDSTAERLLMPSNAATRMFDCVPLKQGGLRAFLKAENYSTTGIVDIANERPTGIFVRGGIALRSGAAGDGSDRYLATVHQNDFKHRLYRMDGTNGETTWKQQKANWTSAAGLTSGTRQTQFGFYRTVDDRIYVLMVIRLNGSADIGLWTIEYVAGAGPPAGDGVATKIQSYTGPLAVNQARIMIGDGGGIKAERLHYSDVATLTFGALNFLDVEKAQFGPQLTMIAAFAPDDLLIAKEGGAWVQISGDIASAGTPVREMGSDHFGRFTEQVPARASGGIAFIEPNGDIFLTDGRNFQNISKHLRPFPNINGVVSPGQLAWLDGYLFAPGGRVRDFDTGAWFIISDIDAAFWHAEPYAGEFFGVSEGTNFVVKRYRPFGEAAGLRVAAYDWESAPFADEGGRQMAIREVQAFLSCSATSDLSVTVGGVTKTVTGLAAGRHQVPFYFRGRGEMQTVRVQPSAQSASNEAPMLERIRAGLVDGHQLR